MTGPDDPTDDLVDSSTLLIEGLPAAGLLVVSASTRRTSEIVRELMKIA